MIPQDQKIPVCRVVLCGPGDKVGQGVRIRAVFLSQSIVYQENILFIQDKTLGVIIHNAVIMPFLGA